MRASQKEGGLITNASVSKCGLCPHQIQLSCVLSFLSLLAKYSIKEHFPISTLKIDTRRLETHDRAVQVVCLLVLAHVTVWFLKPLQEWPDRLFTLKIFNVNPPF